MSIRITDNKDVMARFTSIRDTSKYFNYLCPNLENKFPHENLFRHYLKPKQYPIIHSDLLNFASD